MTVHASQFPEAVQRGLLEGLRARRIPPKYLYETRQQARKWLALHEAFSPARRDPEATAIYERSFLAAAGLVGRRARLIGLGCGGGQKEARLLGLLAGQGKALSYTPCDASLALLLASVRQAEKAAPGTPCHPLLCDLATADDLAEVFDQIEARNGPRLHTFFGLIPNFEPDDILARLAGQLQADDLLLFSANLASGPDYAAGVERVFHGYNNRETCDWLLAFVSDLGIEPDDGGMEFSIEEAAGLRRIAADFRFRRPRTLTVEGERFDFGGGEPLRLFFSYRYTPDRVGRLLRTWQFAVLDQWITPSEEEGVFLCRKT
jgi:L-histidine Nalpha-methyltransferase